MDNTASAEAGEVYEQALAHSIAVVASNKVATSSSRPVTKASRNSPCAPEWSTDSRPMWGRIALIDTIQHLVQSGDRIHKIEGMFSGTLNYVFSNFNGDITFKKVIEDAGPPA